MSSLLVSPELVGRYTKIWRQDIGLLSALGSGQGGTPIARKTAGLKLMRIKKAFPSTKQMWEVIFNSQNALGLSPRDKSVLNTITRKYTGKWHQIDLISMLKTEVLENLSLSTENIKEIFEGGSAKYLTWENFLTQLYTAEVEDLFSEGVWNVFCRQASELGWDLQEEETGTWWPKVMHHYERDKPALWSTLCTSIEGRTGSAEGIAISPDVYIKVHGWKPS